MCVCGDSEHRQQSRSYLCADSEHRQQTCSCLCADSEHRQQTCSCLCADSEHRLQSCSCLCADSEHRQQTCSCLCVITHHYPLTGRAEIWFRLGTLMALGVRALGASRRHSESFCSIDVTWDKFSLKYVGYMYISFFLLMFNGSCAQTDLPPPQLDRFIRL